MSQKRVIFTTIFTSLHVQTGTCLRHVHILLMYWSEKVAETFQSLLRPP